MSIPQGASGCAPFSAGISCTTDANGIATVEFTTTMQPGDNFTIAASTSDTYLTNLSLTADGINLKDTNGIQVPVTTTTTNTCSSTTVRACRAEMLTVWRKLHIEVDSMGLVSNNFVEGSFPTNKRVTNGTKTLSVQVSPDLELNRFENGRITIGLRSYPIIDATSTTNANTANTVTIFNNQGTFEILAGDQFTLVDDDDFNDDDTTGVDGDSGSEDIPEPNMELLQSTDTSCVVDANGKITNLCNVFKPAYVRPADNFLSGSHDNIAFSANVNDAQISTIYTNHFDSIGSHASTNFWTIYFLNAYQFSDLEDGDPDDTIVNGTPYDIVYGTVDYPAAILGATIFTELNRAKEYEILNVLNPNLPTWQNRPVASKYSIAHEVGHLFGGSHEDFDSTQDSGLMAQTFKRRKGIFNDVTIKKIRIRTNP